MTPYSEWGAISTTAPTRAARTKPGGHRGPPAQGVTFGAHHNLERGNAAPFCTGQCSATLPGAGRPAEPGGQQYDRSDPGRQYTPGRPQRAARTGVTFGATLYQGLES